MWQTTKSTAHTHRQMHSIKGTSQIKGKTSGELNVAVHTKYKVQTIVHSHLYCLPNDKCSLCLARCVSLNSPHIICMCRCVNGVKGANVSSVWYIRDGWMERNTCKSLWEWTVNAQAEGIQRQANDSNVLNHSNLLQWHSFYGNFLLFFEWFLFVSFEYRVCLSWRFITYVSWCACCYFGHWKVGLIFIGKLLQNSHDSSVS